MRAGKATRTVHKKLQRFERFSDVYTLFTPRMYVFLRVIQCCTYIIMMGAPLAKYCQKTTFWVSYFYWYSIWSMWLSVGTVVEDLAFYRRLEVDVWTLLACGSELTWSGRRDSCHRTSSNCTCVWIVRAVIDARSSLPENSRPFGGIRCTIRCMTRPLPLVVPKCKF